MGQLLAAPVVYPCGCQKRFDRSSLLSYAKDTVLLRSSATEDDQHLSTNRKWRPRSYIHLPILQVPSSWSIAFKASNALLDEMSVPYSESHTSWQSRLRRNLSTRCLPNRIDKILALLLARYSLKLITCSLTVFTVYVRLPAPHSSWWTTLTVAFS